jgi:glutamine synthetase
LYAARDGPEHLTRAETHFLSGVLTHLPALCALTLPTAASYARMQDGVFSGGTHVAWGRDARETPLRLCGAPRAGAAHFEFRPLDGTANPYVALAGVLGAGSRGIAEKTRLDISPCGQDSPAEMSAEERERHGIVGRLPLDLADARRRLGQDEVLRDILGDVADVWNNVNEVHRCPRRVSCYG